jgi:hypothetical protein
MTLKEKILNSKALHYFYTTISFMELGKSNTSRFYTTVFDILAILTYLKILFGTTFSTIEIILIGLIVALSLISLGYTIRKFGFVNVDRYAQLKNDPVGLEILEAARRINKSKRI